MAKAKKNYGYGSDTEFAFSQLSAEQKSQYIAWVSSGEIALDAQMQSLVDDSYRVTLKYDYNGEAYMCSLTQQDSKHHNSGLVITSRGRGWAEALSLSYFKTFVLFEGKRLPTQEDDKSWG
jgi:hypothetical protein